MLTEVIMPKLGLTMEEGAVQHWHKAEGAPVEQGEPLVDIETDKTVIEVESPASGFLRAILIGDDTSGVPGAIWSRVAVSPWATTGTMSVT
mgnify:CR=1 FL=1